MRAERLRGYMVSHNYFSASLISMSHFREALESFEAQLDRAQNQEL